MLQTIKLLMEQYKQLFKDYAAMNGQFKDEEYPFNVILKNPESAYNKANNIISLIQQHF